MDAWPIVSNTQGGPVHDARQRVVDALGKPIPRLYAAGVISSIFGHLYLEAGNITECFVGGRIAGRGAAGGTAWEGPGVPSLFFILDVFRRGGSRPAPTLFFHPCPFAPQSFPSIHNF